MKYSVSVFANGTRYDIPKDQEDAFRATAAQSGIEVEDGDNFRVNGEIYTIPKSRIDEFKSAAKGAESVRPFTMADGTEKYMTPAEVSKYLRSKEYRESDDYTPPQIESPTWAAIKGGIKGAAEGAYAGGKSAAGKVVSAIPEVLASATEAVGNAINLGGNAKNAVGDWFVNSGRGVKTWLDENVKSKIEDNLGYEDWSTKASEIAGDAAGMAVKFAPAAYLGPAFLETVMASDGINAYAQSFDAAKANNASDAEANLAGLASGLINYYGGKLLMKSGGLTAGIENPLARFFAGGAVSAAAMGVQNAGNKGVENVINGKPITEGMGDAFLGGASEGALFHGMNEVAHAGGAAAKAARETKQLKEVRKAGLLAATEEPNGPEFLNGLIVNKGMDEAVKARKGGADISRKMATAADLPDNLNQAERNQIVDAIIEARETKALNNAKKIDEVQSEALHDEIAGLLGSDRSASYKTAYNYAARAVEEGKELDDPVRRAEIALEAVKAVKGGEKAEPTALEQKKAEREQRLRTPTRVGEAEIAADQQRRAEEREMGNRIEQQAEQMRQAKAEKEAKEQAEYDEKMAEYEEARAKRAEEKKKFGKAKTPLPEKPKELTEKSDEIKAREDLSQWHRKNYEPDDFNAETFDDVVGKLSHSEVTSFRDLLKKEFELEDAYLTSKDEKTHAEWMKARADLDAFKDSLGIEWTNDEGWSIDRSLSEKKPVEPVVEKPAKAPEPKSAPKEVVSKTETTTPADAVKSAQKLLGTKFYQDEAALKREMTKLPPQATKAREAYEVALAEARKRAEAEKSANAAPKSSVEAETPKSESDNRVEKAARIIAETVAKNQKREMTEKDISGQTDNAKRLIADIENKDADALRRRFNGLNQGSVKAFEAITGIKMPATQKGQHEIVDRFCGITPEQRAKIESEKAAATEKAIAERERQRKIDDGKRIIGETKINWNAAQELGLKNRTLDELIEKGWELKKAKRGAANEGRIVEPGTGRYFKVPKGAYAYLEDVAIRAKAKPSDPPKTPEPPKPTKKTPVTKTSKKTKVYDPNKGIISENQLPSAEELAKAHLEMKKEERAAKKTFEGEKKQLLADIDKAIADYGESGEGSEAWKKVLDAEQKMKKAYEKYNGNDAYYAAYKRARDEFNLARQTFRNATRKDGAPDTVEIKVGSTTYTVENDLYSLRQFRKNVEKRYGKEASKRYYEIIEADRLESLRSSPEVLAYAKRNGMNTVDGKVSPGAVRNFLKGQMQKAVSATKRLFKDAQVEVKDREYDEELDGGSRNDLFSIEMSADGIDMRSASTAINAQKGMMTNRHTGIEARLSSNGAGKLISNAAVAKSVANGFTAKQHNEIASRIKELFEAATLIESRPDKNGDVNIRSIKRFATPVNLPGHEKDGACAYITVKESIEHGHRIYSVEEIKLTALPPTVRRVIADRNSAGSAENAVSIAKNYNVDNSVLELRSSEGRVVGTFNPATKKVTLYRGADEKTVYHELIGHGVEDWARRNNTTLHSKLLDLARTAPESLKAEIREKYPDADEATVAKEIIARFAENKGAEKIQLKDAPKNWVAKTYVRVRDAILDFAESLGFNRVNLNNLESLTPAEVIDRVMGEIAKGKTLGEIGAPDGGKMTAGEKWANKYYDRHTSLGKISQKAMDAKTMQPGLEYDFQVRKFNVKKDEYAKLLKEGDVAHEEVAEYMKAKGAEERLARGVEVGIDKATIDETLAHYENHPRKEAIERAADFLWKMQDEGLKHRLDNGLISKEQYDEWTSREKFHVPFRSAIDEVGGEYFRSHRGMEGKEFERAEGRYSESGDPVAFIFEEYADAHLRAIENNARKVLADEIGANAELGRISTNPELREMRVKGDGGEANVVKYKAVGKNGNVVTKAIILNGERGAAAASSYTNRDLKQVWEPARKFMRFWSATATEWSPTFALRNAIKDNSDVALTVLAEKGTKEGVKWIGKYAKNQKAVRSELWDFVRDGTVRKGSTLEKYFKEGGMIGGFERQGYENIRKTFSPEELQKTLGKQDVKTWAGSVPRLIKSINSYTELATRLSAFKTNLEGGMSEAEAAKWSRQITVDFNRKGNATPVMNTLFMFSNSVIGSKVRQLKAINNAAKTSEGRRALALILGLGVARAWLEDQMNTDDEENAKKGKAIGKDVSEYTRKNSLFYFRNGDRIFNLASHDDPLSQLAYLGDATYRLVNGKMSGKEYVRQIAGDTIANSASLFGVGSPSVDIFETDGWGNAQGFTPTALQPVVQLMTNTNFMGSPIYQKKYTEAQPDSYNGRASTSEGYKAFVQLLNDATGGNAGRSGAIDITPETAKHWVDSVGKNVGKDAYNFCNLVYKAMTGTYSSKDTNETPIVRDVTRKYEGNDNRYFQAKEAFDKDKKELDTMKSSWTSEERKAFREAHPHVKTNGAKNTYIERIVNGYRSTTGAHINGINDYRKLENGMVKNGSGKWIPRKTPPTEEQVKAWREKRMILQAKVIEKMGL